MDFPGRLPDKEYAWIDAAYAWSIAGINQEEFDGWNTVFKVTFKPKDWEMVRSIDDGPVWAPLAHRILFMTDKDSKDVECIKKDSHNANVWNVHRTIYSHS